MSITTSTGTTISAVDSDEGRLVIFENPNAPEDLRLVEVGRITHMGFQPVPFSQWGISAETLRGIADLMEQEEDTVKRSWPDPPEHSGHTADGGPVR